MEERLGHVKYLLFYLACVIVAVWAHVVTDVDSTVPLIGASGAISAVQLLGFWFILQLFQGVGSLGPGSGGVAYMAHVGGFPGGDAGDGPVQAGGGRAPLAEGRWGVDRF